MLKDEKRERLSSWRSKLRGEYEEPSNQSTGTGGNYPTVTYQISGRQPAGTAVPPGAPSLAVDNATMTVNARARQSKDKVRNAKLQTSAKSWINKPQHKPVRTMRRPDGTQTANTAEQIDLVTEAWKPHFERFKDGEPDAQAFFDVFSPHMKQHHFTVSQITAEGLIDTLGEMKHSSSGLDN